MSHTKVWLNGEYVGEWPYGYSSFRLDLTDKIKIGQENTLAVRLDNKANSSRWYPGGGIYRNVRLVKTHPVHINHWGIFTTTPKVSAEKATVHIETQVVGSEDTKVTHEITEDGSTEVIATGEGATCSISIDAPKRWNLKQPNLYQLKTSISKEGTITDSKVTSFGIRKIEYISDGFFLHGKSVRMNGVCQHHDLGPLGSAVNVRAMERQIEILKEFDVNAIRTAHNPPDPAFLDLCDRMGILVQVEAFDVWQLKKK